MSEGNPSPNWTIASSRLSGANLQRTSRWCPDSQRPGVEVAQLRGHSVASLSQSVQNLSITLSNFSKIRHECIIVPNPLNLSGERIYYQGVHTDAPSSSHNFNGRGKFFRETDCCSLFCHHDIMIAIVLWCRQDNGFGEFDYCSSHDGK